MNPAPGRAARPRSPHRASLRLGVFGGTFDPPHLGHLLVAETARDTLALDRVVFVPARVPPHKMRRAVSLLQKYTAAQMKYTMMLRFVSWIASHTFVLPVSR